MDSFDVETRFDTSKYELDRPLSKVKTKKVIGSMKDELGGTFTTKFFGLRAKSYSCLTADSRENKNAKGTKKWVIKKKLKFEKVKLILSNSTWV